MSGRDKTGTVAEFSEGIQPAVRCGIAVSSPPRQPARVRTDGGY